MNDHEPIGALERSLHAGPADEAGYRAEAIDYAGEDTGRSPLGSRIGGRSVRLVRRSRSWSRALAFAEVVAVVVVLVIGGLAVLQRSNQFGASPPPSPSPVRSPIPVPALTETFVSPRNGFSVRYPAGWSTKPATSTWRPNTYLPIGNSALDELKLQGEARFVMSSQRLALGVTEASWIAAFSQPYDLGACSVDRAAWPRLTVDGRSGYLDLAACPFPADAGFSTPDVDYDLIVFAGGRVYEIGLDGVVDLAYFEAILATVHLDPASAIDPPEGT